MKLEINRQDWIIERLGDFAISEKGKKPKNQSEIQTEEFKYPYVDIQGFEKKIFDSYTDGVKCNFCTEDDFLMVWDGSRSGLVGKAVSGAIGSTLVKINLPMIENHFTYYFLKSKYLEINTNAKGTGTPHVNPDLLWNYSFPIVPTLEQKTIVAKIEQLFSELDNGIANLKTAKAKLKIYRQAVFKKAFEGELTNTKNITWVQIKDIINNVEYGTSSKSDNDGLAPVLRMGNIQNGKIDWEDLKFSSDKEEIEKYKLRKNDVLFNRTNSPEHVGKTAIYKSDREAIFAGYLIRINYKQDEINGSYLSYFMNSHTAKKYGDSVKSFGVNQSNINGTKLKTYPFPLCSLEEQNQIVQEIESRLSVCDKIEETIETSLEKSEALRQSILKKAFEGKLLSELELENIKNHPEYESAEELLKRIKKERKS